jgi:hypothetical protein
VLERICRGSIGGHQNLTGVPDAKTYPMGKIIMIATTVKNSNRNDKAKDARVETKNKEQLLVFQIIAL